MPVAEENTSPKGGAYGSGVAEEEFLAATQPAQDTQLQPTQPLVQNVFEPAPSETNLARPEDVLNQGIDLLPDEAAVLFQEEADPEELGAWAPVLRELAALPNASPQLRQLANQVDRRVTE